MIEDTAMDYSRARRQRYLSEIGLPAQIGAIIDELVASRAGEGSASFTALLERISAIKSAIPKP